MGAWNPGTGASSGVAGRDPDGQTRLYRLLAAAVKLARVGVLASLLGLLGFADEAIQRAQEREALLAELNERWEAGDGEYVLVVLADYQGDWTPRLRNLQGMCLAAAGDHPAAVAAYEAAMHQSLLLPELHLNLAISLEAMGATGRAMAEFEEAVRLDPSSVEAQLGLGRARLRFRRTALAQASLEAAQAIAPDDPRVLEARAELAEAQGDTDAAIEHRSRLFQLDPAARHARRVAELATSAEARRHWYALAFEADPTDLEVAGTLGSLHLDAGDPSTALSYLQAALDGGNEDPAVQLNLLLAFQSTGDRAEIEAAIRQLSPRSGAAWGVVGLVRRAGGDSEAALAAVEAGLGLAPDDLELVNLLAVCLDDLGRTDEAIERWEWILSRDPEHTEARGNLEARKP